MRALVLLSGGLDSTVTLALATKECDEVYTVGFDYGQKHCFELNQSKLISQKLGAKKHYIINVDVASFIKSNLVGEDKDTTHSEDSVENTYVPARNTLFLSYAAALAESIEADRIYLGVSGVDYGGQRPDTREVFVKRFQDLIDVALNCTANDGKKLEIVAPFVNTERKDRIKKGIELGVDFSLTRTCYAVSEDGISCGVCDSCLARKEAFASLGMEDPIPYQEGEEK